MVIERGDEQFVTIDNGVGNDTIVEINRPGTRRLRVTALHFKNQFTAKHLMITSRNLHITNVNTYRYRLRKEYALPYIANVLRHRHPGHIINPHTCCFAIRAVTRRSRIE
jgi:hypothetical protein